MIVFGNVHTFPEKTGRTRRTKKKVVIEVASRMMERMKAEMRVRTALKGKLPPPTKYDVKPAMRCKYTLRKAGATSDPSRQYRYVRKWCGSLIAER